MPRLLPLLVLLLVSSAAASSGSQVRRRSPTGQSPLNLARIRCNSADIVLRDAGAGSGTRGAFPAGAGAGGTVGGGAGRDGARAQRHAAAARGQLPALRALHLLRRGQAHLRPRALLLRHQLQHPQPPLRVLLLHAQVLRLPRMQPLRRRRLSAGFIQLVRVRVREWGSKEYV